MATQTLEFNAGTGLTLSCKIFALGSDTVVDTQTATEKTNDKNRYSVAYTDIPAGAYRLNAFVGATGGFANENYDLTLTTATFHPRGESKTDVSSLALEATSQAIKAKTDLITAGNISVLQDRVNDSTITMQFNESTAATVNLDEDTTSATLQFVVARPDGTDVLTIANGLITRTSTSFTVTITTAVTGTIGQYLWSLRDLSGGGNRVVTKGVLTVANAAAIDA